MSLRQKRELRQKWRHLLTAAIAASPIVFSAPVFGQTPAAGNPDSQSALLHPPTIEETLSKPGTQTLLGSNPQSAQKGIEGCIEVEINGQRSYDCTNRKLEEKAKGITGQANIPPYDARGNDVQLGAQNQTALQQQFGSNYGKSIFPFRPKNIVISPLNPAGMGGQGPKH